MHKVVPRCRARSRFLLVGTYFSRVNQKSGIQIAKTCFIFYEHVFSPKRVRELIRECRETRFFLTFDWLSKIRVKNVIVCGVKSCLTPWNIRFSKTRSRKKTWTLTLKNHWFFVRRKFLPENHENWWKIGKLEGESWKIWISLRWNVVMSYTKKCCDSMFADMSFSRPHTFKHQLQKHRPSVPVPRFEICSAINTKIKNDNTLCATIRTQLWELIFWCA